MSMSGHVMEWRNSIFSAVSRMGKERQRRLGRDLVGEFGFSFLSVEAVLSASDKALATTLYVERRGH